VVAPVARHCEMEGPTPTVMGMHVEQLWRHPVKSSVATLTKRCAIVQRPQPGLPKDIGLARTIIHRHGNMLGIYASVLTDGRITLGDQVHPA
jgi:uncharacterized protein YcbX